MRYVALGDSFTEGVGDDDERYPNGLRGWADRVAEQWSREQPDLLYANLAIRGRLLRPIVSEQLDACLALRPDVVTIHAGGNDLLRRSVDIDDLMRVYEAALRRLRDNGTRVLVWTSVDPLRVFAGYSMLRGRVAIFNEMIREHMVDGLQCELVDMWRMSEYVDSRYWSWDRLHMSQRGHIHMASEALKTLGVSHQLSLPELPPLPKRSRAEIRRADFEWAREFAMPWVGRRIRGTSSGDGVVEKYSDYVKAADMPHGANNDSENVPTHG